MARAIATRCCWPPDSSPGRVMFPACQPDLGQRGARRMAAGGRLAAVDQRQLDVLQRVVRASRLKPWNTKPR
jgi:hypothetical protein